jgi:hypothetical protein
VYLVVVDDGGCFVRDCCLDVRDVLNVDLETVLDVELAVDLGTVLDVELAGDLGTVLDVDVLGNLRTQKIQRIRVLSTKKEQVGVTHFFNDSHF